ncbi:ShlB/FhaC/HecB family hemolysin secretion/activation protein [Deltaproteobacteria bacterium TL4]
MYLRLILVILCLIMNAAGIISAQVPPPPQDKPFQEAPLSLPPNGEEQPEIKLPGFELPALSKGEEKELLSVLPKLLIKKFRFEGNTAISTGELETLSAPYENREITAQELQILRRQLTLLYVNRGYLNSGVLIPDQPVQNGEITFRVIEGRVVRIELSGNKGLREGYFKSRLERGTNEGKAPLNINDLSERLKLLQQNPKIERIVAELRPDVQKGDAWLKVEVQETSLYHLQIKLNNHSSPSVGEFLGEVQASHHNVTGWGDTLKLSYAGTEGMESYSGNYEIPLNRWDTTVGVSSSQSKSSVITKAFKDLEIQSQSSGSSVFLRQPLYTTLSTEFTLSLKVERRQSQTFMLGEPFTFSPGALEGKSRVSVVRFSQEWLTRSQARVIALRSTFSNGIDEWEPTLNKNAPDGIFALWLGQVQWIQRVSTFDSQFLFRLDTQNTKDALLSLEQFAIGGASTVRGYRENYQTGDNAVFSSLEWRIPLLPLFLSSKEGASGVNSLQGAPFIDYGKVWNVDDSAPQPDDIYSIGFGIRWLPASWFQSEIYWGKAQTDRPSPEEKAVQDDGIHIQIAAIF